MKYSERGEQDFSRTTQLIVVGHYKPLDNSIINPLPSSFVNNHVDCEYNTKFSANCSLGKLQPRISAAGFQGNDLSQFDDIESLRSYVTIVSIS